MASRAAAAKRIRLILGSRLPGSFGTWIQKNTALRNFGFSEGGSHALANFNLHCVLVPDHQGGGFDPFWRFQSADTNSSVPSKVTFLALRPVILAAVRQGWLDSRQPSLYSQSPALKVVM